MIRKRLFMNMVKTVAICFLFVTGVQTQQIEGVINVTAVKGYEAILQCEAPGKGSNKPVQFQVNKEDNNTMIAIYNPPVNKILNSSYKPRATLEVTEKSVTIIIKEAQESDKGWYSCQIHTFPGGKVVQKIYLHIKDYLPNSPSSRRGVIIGIGVFAALVLIGAVFMFLFCAHQRKDRVYIPKQVNIIVKNSQYSENKWTSGNNDRTTSNEHSEDTYEDYLIMSHG
ncbi:uncharacterized protein LOC103184826 [Callorhinchus milii]|uniref:Uncharacterized LOC103184826 n=1 Tax=Callorhinchus milii TaxID=7868 RepID=A0A4W3H596_CALMI|nr:uncharacterized protein LOC103184826 [Callorhinchus milii]|eukprot:gi/632969698/ref/XP_007901226.1/ PREDICTED: uncharacterized protein LOC103184826 [Callorhinchus milii]